MLNTQAPEKRSTLPATHIEVHSIFKTIQGEGPFCGTPAVFVRLAGCNLQCPGCDTEYTDGRRVETVGSIVEEVSRIAGTAQLVVITGGEPFRQDLSILFTMLRQHGYYVQVETNGTLPVTPYRYEQDTSFPRLGVFIVCSPKTGSVHPSIMANACALKYVMHHSSIDPTDGLPILALDHSAKPRVARPKKKPGPGMFIGGVYLQPMDTKCDKDNAKSLQAVMQSCLEHGYILQLQVHKLIDVE